MCRRVVPATPRYSSALLHQFGLDRLACLCLHDDGAGPDLPAENQVANPDFHDVTAAQLAVDRQSEQQSVPHAPVLVEEEADELRLIAELAYAPYLLPVHSIAAKPRRREILSPEAGGAAANRAVCHVLGITSIDPARSELLFERVRFGRVLRAARY
jgi:DNA polymerase III alpha subunit